MTQTCCGFDLELIFLLKTIDVLGLLDHLTYVDFLHKSSLYYVPSLYKVYVSWGPQSCTLQLYTTTHYNTD